MLVHSNPSYTPILNMTIQIELEETHVVIESVSLSDLRHGQRTNLRRLKYLKSNMLTKILMNALLNQLFRIMICLS